MTYFFVRNDLDRDLAIEDEQFATYLRANGWDGHFGAVEKSAESVLEVAGSHDVKK